MVMALPAEFPRTAKNARLAGQQMNMLWLTRITEHAALFAAHNIDDDALSPVDELHKLRCDFHCG